MTAETLPPQPQLQQLQQQSQQQQQQGKLELQSAPMHSSSIKQDSKRVVSHNYHDHSQRMTPLPAVLEVEERKRGGPRGGVTCPFPERLHMMLTGVESSGHTGIVSWQPHGRCFIVHKPKDFVKDIMPTYFRQTKLTSFQRQLNLYGFIRLTSGRDRGGYYHELFLRGREFLCNRILRTRVKGIGIKAANNPNEEPDFYLMPFVGKLDEKSSNHSHSMSPTTVTLVQQSSQQQTSSGILSSTLRPTVVNLPHSVEETIVAGQSDTVESVASAHTLVVPIIVTPTQTPLMEPIEGPPALSLLVSSPPEQLKPTLLQLELQQQQQPEVPPIATDTPLFFEGMRFHYIDPTDFERSFRELAATMVTNQETITAQQIYPV